MEDLLYCKDFYNPIEGDTATPYDKSHKKWERMNKKTFGFIRQFVDDCVFHQKIRYFKLRTFWI